MDSIAGINEILDRNENFIVFKSALNTFQANKKDLTQN
jgi:hypothetical protein